MKRLVASVLLASVFGGPAFALVLCQTRADALFARATCRRKETPLPLTAIGVIGAPGSPGGKGIPGPAPLSLVDASGQNIGEVTATESFLVFVTDGSIPVTFVLLKSLQIGQPLLLGVNLAGEPTGLVRYEASDCTGTPLVQGGGFLLLAQVVADTVFYPSQPTAATTGNSVETTDRSHGCTSITARGGCCRTEVSALMGFETAATTTLGALGITPPLHAVLAGP